MNKIKARHQRLIYSRLGKKTKIPPRRLAWTPWFVDSYSLENLDADWLNRILKRIPCDFILRLSLIEPNDALNSTRIIERGLRKRGGLGRLKITARRFSIQLAERFQELGMMNASSGLHGWATFLDRDSENVGICATHHLGCLHIVSDRVFLAVLLLWEPRLVWQYYCNLVS